ncbi:uncharacterized membrane protein HdeD (DUF308 family)/pimeloyl-ACP methyl ester carboxylesterase [Microbacterium terrae]|uniref:Inactive lipase n=1 Tax=Microbacterium terrae TaxID=69369 RepID=A0A0M2HBW3_9MICO|nr:lipase family protein [Microbacterium terrae]KJL43994.1 putative inactive lipase [Microbacterium terrae]MBP1077798.1 uncharacterized membrane protein HdeD (DUF308 family)/pimeloyl-ACP methyl ester carboxylesterase [Microbacterium terrae]GLJ99968.1 hypothetical protein GCM10017594_31660 [Microbacterium terrae]
MREARRRTGTAWSALPRLTDAAPTWVLAVIGAAAVLLGVLIVARPLTSLLLLTVYIGLSAIVTGIAQLVAARRASRWSRLVFALIWIVLGVAVLVGFGRTLELLPDILAVLLIVGGLASAFDAIAGGTVSERVLAICWSAAQLTFGVLAFAWPDVTVLVAAVVFGIRCLVFGATLLFRAIRAFAGPRAVDGGADAAPPAPSRRVAGLLAAGRYGLSAVLVALAVGVWGLSSWLADGAPVVDAFYDPPATVPYAHGELIRADAFAGQHPEGADVTRILYTTRDALGDPAVASALVIVPEERRAGARPVIAWNHGTTGVARGCAPSLRDASATKWAIPALDDAIDRGWVVVASDYSGQGAPGVFPYLIGRGEARSSLDAVLAARQLPGLALSERTVAWGHSQGGHAALWMSQIAADYAPGIEMLGTAVLAPVTDPLALAEEATARDDDILLTILISWVLVPYADTYPNVDVSDYVASGGETIVREMTQRCPSEPGVVVSIATGLGVSEDRPLYVEDLTAGALGERLADNAATGPWETPVLVTWGDADEVIPPHLQQEFVERLCADGVQARWVIFQGYDHLATLLPRSRFLPVLTRWTQARFSGTDAPVDDCNR